MKSRPLSLLVCAMAATVAWPREALAIDDTTGYVLLSDSDPANASSFNSAGKWESGAKPESGKKYLVNRKINLRTPTSRFTTPFAGDSLTFDNEGSLQVKSASGSTISADFILYYGTIAANVNDDNNVSYQVNIGGSVNACGTSERPSRFVTNSKATEIMVVSAPLTGDVTAFIKADVLNYRATSLSRIAFKGDNSAYMGRFEFNCGSEMNPYGYLEFDGATSVGATGDPSGSEPFLTINQTSQSHPVVELKNVQMDSRFTIACNAQNASIELMGTNVLFGASLTGSYPGIPVSVGCNAMLKSASALALTFADGTHLLARLNANGACDYSTIADGTTLSLPGEKIPIRLDGILPLTNGTFSATLLTIPTSVRAVTPTDIDLDADDFGLMTRTITVDESNGIQTVSVTFTGNVVYYSVPNTSISEGSWAAYNQAAQYWSDNQAVHSDADYLINYDVPSACSSIRGCGQTFRGRSLTFARGGVLMLKGSQAHPDAVDDLRMFPGSKIALVNTPLAVSGKLTTTGKPGDDPVVFATSGTRTLYLYSNLAGEGPVRFENNANGTYTVVISGRNESFTGTIEFYGESAGRKVAMTIGDEANLGGNPSEFNAAQVWFRGPITIKAANDVVIDDANRGITFDVTAATAIELNAPAEATLTLNVPMVINANLEKTGAGTLGVGGSITGTASNLTVSAGSVMPVTRQASSALRYTMADGAGIALALDSEDGGVAADGLYVEDAAHLIIAGAMPVTIKGSLERSRGTVKVGIVNVPSDMADTVGAAIGSTATFENSATGRTRQFPIMRETLVGGRVRFYAEVFVPGFILTFR